MPDGDISRPLTTVQEAIVKTAVDFYKPETGYGYAAKLRDEAKQQIALADAIDAAMDEKVQAADAHR